MAMFRDKKCNNCGEKIKDEWEFCPYCGEETRESDFEGNLFSDMEDNIESDFKRIDKMFGSSFFNIPKVNMQIPRKSSGISIIINSGIGKEPKIEVRTSGGFKNLEPEIKRNLGVKSIVERAEPKIRKISKITEPETEIKAAGNKQIIQIKLPEIKNFKDIDVKKLEQSLEIKAFTNDKTYFKLVPIPSDSEIVNKEFKNSVLKIEIGR